AIARKSPGFLPLPDPLSGSRQFNFVDGTRQGSGELVGTDAGQMFAFLYAPSVARMVTDLRGDAKSFDNAGFAGRVGGRFDGDLGYLASREEIVDHRENQEGTQNQYDCH